MNMKDSEMELLMFNYKNLHESIWDNHKVSWVVTSIFIPVIFVMQGYLVREFYDFSKLQIIMGVFVTEFLLIIWLLIMWIFKNYNDLRRKRLKNIEDLFNNKEISEEISQFFEDDKGFNQYNLKYRKPIPIKFLNFSCKIEYSFMGIYHTIFWMFTFLNVFLLVAKFLFSNQVSIL